MSMHEIDQRRRDLLRGALALAAAPVLGTVPVMTLAKGKPRRKLVVILLRGAMDGLAAVPPHGDPRYQKARGELALSSTDILDLDGFFGLHAKLHTLHQLYRQNQLLVLHASATPYRERSHFRAQDLLELGTYPMQQEKGGWLNRSLSPIQTRGTGSGALAAGGPVPLILRGPTAVKSWAPAVRASAPDDAYFERVLSMYQDQDPLKQALISGLDIARAARQSGAGRRTPRDLAKATASLLRGANATSDLAVIDSIGWDTHQNQGTGNGLLAKRLETLGTMVAALRDGMGADWNRTAVLIMTEFGRTVAPNGTAGTDHGTASVAFLAGGAVKGGRVIGDWPGLKPGQLYQRRDLYPANDLRALCKGILLEHYGLPLKVIESEIFPDSSAAGIYRGLIRT